MSKDNKVALVTGGNRGIGYELVKQLASIGFKVILTSRDPEMGREAAQRLKESNLDVSFAAMDINNQESIRQAAAAVNERYGRLDVLINNAGVYLDNGKLLNMEPSQIENTLATNFFGAYHVIRSFIPLMEKQGYGRIINVSSEYGAMSEMSCQGAGAYKLSKLALNGLTRLVAAEIKGDIKINAVDPGWVSSDMGGPSAPRTPKQAAEDPEVLVLDEATSALDLETERQLLALLDERRKGLTTIMIAHRLSTIENADVIFVMDEGSLAESGTHDELLANGRVYRQLLMAQH